MLNNLSTKKPAIALAIGIIIIFALLLLSIISFIIWKTPEKTALEPFKQKIILKEQPEKPKYPEINNKQITKEIKEMHRLMEEHRQEMEKLQQEFFNDSQIPDNLFSFDTFPESFQEFNKLAQGQRINMNLNFPDNINIEEYKDKYIVTVDISDNSYSEKDVIIDVQPNRVNIELKSAKSTGNTIFNASTIQSYGFHSAVDISSVKRESTDKQITVTIPKKTPATPLPEYKHLKKPLNSNFII
jgi:HSP20 family molecular chaperone IbpA